MVLRVGGRREGGAERAVGHSEAATAAAIAVVIAPPHDTLSPSAFSQVNGCVPPYDAMRISPRYHVSRGGQCASRELLGSLGRQLLTNYREVRYITRMCPFRPRSRHMQQIPGQ
jgi:hypothetical protein